MRNRKIQAVIAPLFLMVLWPVASLWSGSIDPSFETKLDQIKSSEMVSAMVMMSDEVDLETLDNELILDRATRQKRHETIVLALRDQAELTQKEVLRFLEASRASGDVNKIQPFWVTNAIAVTLTKDLVYRLSERADVGVIYEDMIIPLDETFRAHEGSTLLGEDPPTTNLGIEHGVSSLNADSLWRMGITGAGVLVCNLDTGVDGNHPALTDRWRGNDPGVAAGDAWFDPYNGSSFPVDDDGHGTGTMGCMVGVDHATGDTVGVAIDAEWIAANVFEGGTSSSSAFTGAFEWTIDPDGDPATIDDVPDVINNSWGSGPGCGAGYWSSIDANMAAGIMVVWSAGNDGPGPQTTGSPASRITTPTNAFAVGATNPSNTIASFSSRGPSSCDGSTIKPEVVAHGTNIRTSNRGGGYTFGWAGTSFSGPYVAGALALLRDVASYATGTELMEIMMNTATDLGTLGEDNDYGHGIPDLVAAASEVLLLERAPRIVLSGSVVSDGGDGEPEAGESFDFIVYLGNQGINTTGVEATLSLTTPDPYVTIDSDFSTFGDIDRDMTGNNSGAPFHVSLDSLTPGAHDIGMTLDVTADGGAYTRQLEVSLRTPFMITMADHNVGNVLFSVSDGGKLGWAQEQSAGSGFVFPIDSHDDHLFEGSFIAGYDSLHVSHSARTDPAGTEATDWQLVPGGEMQMNTPGTVSDQDGFSRYSDSGSDNPMDVEITQRSYAWSDTTHDDFVIVETTIHNTGIDSSSDISNLYIGTYMDWDVLPFFGTPRNNAAVDTAYDVGYMWNLQSNTHCGVHVLTEPGIASFDLIDNQAGGYDFSKAEYWASMSGGIADYSGNGQDWSYVLTTGPFDIAAGDSVVAAFAILAGTDHEDLINNLNAAREMYGSPVGVGDSGHGGGAVLPRAFSLSQNYPNPFNPSTTIRYEVPDGAGERVNLEIFDVRGRKVRTIVDGSKAPGRYSVQWNGRGDGGETLSSGVYLYRLTSGEFEQTRRMLLLK